MKDNQQELFIVVDANDTILEYRTRYDCHHDKTLLHRAVGIVIKSDKGEILLQKRSMKKDLNPGKYSVSSSGHVMKGQTYAEAAERELKEELGIQIPITFAKKFSTLNIQESEMCAAFTGVYNGPFNPSMDEVDMIEFVSVERLKTMQDQFAPIDWETLRQLEIV